jgi:hypothetical protein
MPDSSLTGRIIRTMKGYQLTARLDDENNEDSQIQYERRLAEAEISGLSKKA